MNRVHRRQFLRQTLLGAAVLAAGCRTRVSAPAAAGGRPNIVFFLVDDLGYGEVGFNGGTLPTPHLDGLAAGGAILRQFYVQSVCSPTRAALMTGRYPMRLGLQVGVIRPWAEHGLPLAERTLAQALREAGYYTSICGKWHLGCARPEYLPTRRGFDHQYGHYCGMIDCYTHMREGGFDWHRNDRVCREEGYSTDLLAREAVNIIETRGGRQPLFLYVPFNAVHTPIQAPPAWVERFAHLPRKEAVYAGMLAALDDAIGRIVAALDRRGLRENTLIIFSSDNGGPRPGSNGKFRGRKGSLYEGGVRAAACVNWPGRIAAGGVVEAPLHMVDWYPTLLALGGASPVQALPVDGRDLWPVLTAGRPSPHEEILLNAAPRGGAIRVGDWKLIVGNAGAAADDGEEEQGAGAPAAPAARRPRRVRTVAGPRELYHLRTDPGEQNNLAAQEPERMRDLLARYERLARTMAPPPDQTKPAGFKPPAVWGEP